MNDIYLTVDWMGVFNMSNSLFKFFNPKSIAVIGVSRREDSMGTTILKNLIENKERGLLQARIYGVNIKGGSVLGMQLYKSVKDIEDDIDLVIVVVPAKFVPDVIREAGEKGVKAAIIVSAGFSEVGNFELDHKLRSEISRFGIRVIGPNCIGVLDNYSGINTFFLPRRKRIDGKEMESMPIPRKGHVTFISQSGAMGGTTLDYLHSQNIGINKFINLGNKIDVDEVELLKFLQDDENTWVVMMYLEGISGENRGRDFYEIAKEFTKQKPIVVYKGGKTEAGSRGVASHTASMAGNIGYYDALFKSSGIYHANTVMEFIDATKALLYQPPAKGDKIAIITNGGGPGIATSDYAEYIGLKVPSLSRRDLAHLEDYVSKGIIPSVATFANPIDLSASATAESYRAALEVMLESDNIDGVILLALHHPPDIKDEFVSKLIREIKKHTKPVTVVDVGSVSMAEWIRESFDANGIPAYDLPERGAIAMKALVEYGRYLLREGKMSDYLELYKRTRGEEWG